MTSAPMGRCRTRRRDHHMNALTLRKPKAQAAPKDSRHGVRPGVSAMEWFGTHYLTVCERHYHEVSSIDPSFHACADCGHGWRTEGQRQHVPGAYCDTCARVAAR